MGKEHPILFKLMSNFQTATVQSNPIQLERLRIRTIRIGGWKTHENANEASNRPPSSQNKNVWVEVHLTIGNGKME